MQEAGFYYLQVQIELRLCSYVGAVATTKITGHSDIHGTTGDAVELTLVITVCSRSHRSKDKPVAGPFAGQGGGWIAVCRINEQLLSGGAPDSLRNRDRVAAGADRHLIEEGILL